MNSGHQIEEIQAPNREKQFIVSSVFKKEAIKEIWVGQNCEIGLEITIRSLLDGDRKSVV